MENKTNRNLLKFLDWLGRKSNFLLIDLESNAQLEWTFNMSEMETIQIWYVVFDYRFNLIERWSIFIRPTKNHILSEFIKWLTWITQKQVDNWVSFIEWLWQMMNLFKEYDCDYILSYWNYDMKQFLSDCQLNNVDYPFYEWDKWHSERHINIKNAIASKTNIKEKWMHKLMEYLWLQLEWTHHNGEDDCFNILKIIRHEFG